MLISYNYLFVEFFYIKKILFYIFASSLYFGVRKIEFSITYSKSNNQHIYNMNKFYIAGIVALTSFGARADYSSLVFKTTDGMTHSVGLTDLSIEFSESSMSVQNSDTTLTLPLASLVTMEFSDGSTIIVEHFVAEHADFCIFTAAGVAMGKFSSLEAAAASLPEGVYVMKSSNGDTSKIMIRK